MQKEEVKTLIWRLDATLATFGGVTWMENVGRVARLKELFFRAGRSLDFTLSPISPDALAELNRLIDVVARDGSSTGLRDAAFDTAVSRIAALLTDDPGGAA